MSDATLTESLGVMRRVMRNCGCTKWARIIEGAILPERPAEPALPRFNVLWEFEDGHDPLERLRFFCSLAMSARDRLDAEPFFDALARPEAAGE